MTRFLSAAFALAFCAALAIPAARAQEFPPGHMQDDRVILDLSGEDWVTTKTARVTVNVEAAVSAATAGSTRDEMFKAVNGLVKADWRLTDFNRSQDQTGLERWSASFEARVPENQLGGLNEDAKKAGKAGLQLSVGGIDFTPTLDETETARAALRTQITKQASDQLAALNAALPGHNYRIALIDFTGGEGQSPAPQPMRRVMSMAMVAPAPAGSASAPAERAEKVTLTAHVIFAAAPEHPAPTSAPPPAPEAKH